MTDSKAIKKTVIGMRLWEVTKVKAECPYCGCENKYIVGLFDDDEIWYGAPSDRYCCVCGGLFTVEVDDDDR